MVLFFYFLQPSGGIVVKPKNDPAVVAPVQIKIGAGSILTVIAVVSVINAGAQVFAPRIREWLQDIKEQAVSQNLHGV